MSEIKNCPFCQAKAMPDQPIPNAFLIDHKQGCFLTSTVFYPGDYKSVAKSWNARVLPPEVERLVKTANRFCEQDERWLRSQVENLPNHMPAMRDRFLELIDALAALKGK